MNYKKKAYLDSGVLIAEFRGPEDISQKFLKLLGNEEYEFYVSDAVWMEIFPKAIYNKSNEEVEFYQAIFDNCIILNWDERILKEAKTLAKNYGLSAMDAFHIVFSVHEKIDEFITSETRNKPFFRVKEIKVINHDNLD
ncbi:MAG TPA: type II toxin-antitoxin system VapC family toxin [Spirochaetota bacterium]|jgi:hypothetical protein|nr:type II toxin-antitoxin system VapC family toxin [Spirochaetota bacterium]